MKHYVDNYILNPTHQLTVNVIGCGGTGSQVLTSLGRMNYALKQLGHPGFHVTAFDDDIVTHANCGRQLFSPVEIGRYKAEVLVTKLNMFFGTQWESKCEMYDKGSKVANITISCTDTIASRLVIKDNVKDSKGYDRQRQIYWLDFGNMKDRGQVILGTFKPVKQPKGGVGSLKCVTDIFDFSTLKDSNSGPSCSLAEALNKQDLFINSTLANIGMALLWKMFTKGVIDYHGAFLNLETMRVNPLKIEEAE